MLFTQQDLGVSTNAFGILNESIYIDHNTISPNTASVIVNEDINAGIVRFSDVESISEEYGCDYIDAMIAIAESNDIDIEQLAVAVDEARIIEEPDIIYELANVVINPISENSLAYIFCESMVDAYIESGDEDYLTCIIDEEVLMEKVNTAYSADHARAQKAKNIARHVSGSFAANAALKNKEIAQGIGREHDRLATQNAQMSSELDDTKKRLSTARGHALRNKEVAENMIKANDANAKNLATLQGKWYNRLGSKTDKITDAIGRNKGKIGLGMMAASAAGYAAYKNRDKLSAGASAAKGLFDKAKAKISGDGGSAAANAQAILKQAEGKPKSWISKKIASLRSIYQNYLQKAREAGPNASTFKQIAAKILSVIDALLKKLENATA